MTQNMGSMDFSDGDEPDEDAVVGYLELMPPYHSKLGWHTMEIKDGETTVGRDEDRDITIADSTVSALHAAFDVVGVPGEGGGKRITLKDLRSTNGTFVVDAKNGVKDRLLPKKTTMLPEDGCQIYFGAVFCKVAMSGAPYPSALEEGNAGEAAYEAETQMPDAVLDEDKEAIGGRAEDSKKDNTESVPPVEEDEPADKATAGRGGEGAEEAGAGALAGEDLTSEAGINQGADEETETEKDIVGADDTDGSGNDARNKLASPEGAVGGRSHERDSEGVDFRRVGAMDMDSSKDGVASGEDREVYEPPTQAMAMELDGTLEDDEVEQGVEGSGESQGQDRVDPFAASPAEYGAAAAVSASVNSARGANSNSRADMDSGEDTADEEATARLFEEEDDELEEAIVDEPEAVCDPDQEVTCDAMSTFAATPLTPRPTLQGPVSNRQATSPGCASDASTERQEMPERSSNCGGASGQEKAGGNINHIAFQSDAGKGNSGDDGDGGAQLGIQGTNITDGRGMNKAGDMSSDEDDGSEASGALLSAEDQEDFEDSELAGLVPQVDRNAAKVDSQLTSVGDSNNDGAEGTCASEEEKEAADDSGSETDATEIDTDDGPSGDLPDKEHQGEDVSATRSTGINSREEASGDAAPSRDSERFGENSSPGGSLLSRSTTEDTMKAIAREQYRAQAAMAVASAAREGADAMECESREIRAAGGADGADDEVNTQAMPMSEDEEEVRSEPGVEGTEIMEETESLGVLGDEVTASLPGSRNTEQAVAASKDPDASAVEPGPSSREAVPAESALGDHGNPKVSDFAHARGTTENSADSGKSEIIFAAEGCEVPVPFTSADDGNLDREQVEMNDVPVHGEVEKNDDLDGKAEEGGKDELEAGKRVEEIKTVAQRGARETPAVPRTSGRRRKKPKAFDDMGHDDSTANLQPVPKVEDNKMRKGIVRQPLANAQGTGDDTPRRGRTRSTRLGASPQTSDKLDKSAPSPIATARRGRGAREAAMKEKGQEDSTKGTNAERRNKQVHQTSRGNNKRRRSEASLGTLDRTPVPREPETPAPRGGASKRSRRPATELNREDSVNQPEGVRAVPEVTGHSGRVRKGPQRNVEGDLEADAADNEVKGKGKGKAKVGRKRAAEGSSDDVPSQGCTNIKGGGSEVENQDESDCTGIGNSLKTRKTIVEDEATLLTPPQSIVMTRHGKKSGVKALDPACKVSSASSRKGRCRLAMAEEERASPRSPRISARSKDRPPLAATLSASTVGSDKPANVKVCFTNVKPSCKERSCIKKLGISEVENVMEATHLVAGGSGVPLKRTPKLLAGIGRCRFVLDVEWLYQSSKEGRVLDGLEYILCDTEAEKKWGFNMRTSLCRRPDTGLLDGLSVFVDPAVAGTKGMGCPPLEEMKMVVASAGGIWMAQLPKRCGPDPDSLLVITHPEALATARSRGAKSSPVASTGRDRRAFLPEMLFLCILRQKMSWPDDLAVGIGQGGGAGAFVQPAKPAKRRRA